MRRSFSLAMGLVLIVAMLGAQASVSVLAQSTPSASPVAGQNGYQFDILAYSKGVGPAGNLDLALIDFTVNVGSKLPKAQHLPSALFEVDSGFIRVTQTDGAEIWVHIGKNGTPITNGEGTEKYCTVETSKNGWCQLKSNQWDAIIGPGSSIALKNSDFTVQGVEEPKILEGFNTGSASIKGFQGSGAAFGKGSILQPSGACYICPWPY